MRLSEAIKTFRAKFLTEALPSDASGQAQRAAAFFALVAYAGELATGKGITGWSRGEAKASALTCLRAWLDSRGGAGEQEPAAMLAQVRRFFELHGEARFTPWPSHEGAACHRCNGSGNVEWTTYEQGVCFICHGSGKAASSTVDNARPTINRAGVRRTEGGETEYFVLREVFQQEVCASFHHHTVAKLLMDRGILIPDKDGKATRSERLPHGIGQTRCYRIAAAKLWED